MSHASPFPKPKHFLRAILSTVPSIFRIQSRLIWLTLLGLHFMTNLCKQSPRVTKLPTIQHTQSKYWQWTHWSQTIWWQSSSLNLLPHIFKLFLIVHFSGKSRKTNLLSWTFNKHISLNAKELPPPSSQTHLQLLESPQWLGIC